MLWGLGRAGLLWSSRARAARACPSPTAPQQGSWRHQGSPSSGQQALPRTGVGQGQARKWEHGQAWLWGTPGQARQGCGELETGAAAALLGQGLTALVLLLGRVGEPQGARHGPGNSRLTPTRLLLSFLTCLPLLPAIHP